MGSISFGGDAESFMDAPTMENKGIAETLAAGSGSPIAVLLDLVGIHRQAAKGPKKAEAPPAPAVAKEVARVPQVLTDVASVLTPQESPIVPLEQNSPVTTWGQRWLDSMKPLQTFDPG